MLLKLFRVNGKNWLQGDKTGMSYSLEVVSFFEFEQIYDDVRYSNINQQTNCC
jgi:hypothetical protein